MTAADRKSRRPMGALKAAILAAHAQNPRRTAKEIAELIGTRSSAVYMTASRCGLTLAQIRPRRVAWTDEMLRRLQEGALKREGVNYLAEQIGVSPATLSSGFAELVRRMAEGAE